MDEPAFSDFGRAAPGAGDRRRSKAAVASMVIGLLGPVTCLGGIMVTARALEAISYRAAVAAMVLPIALSLAGLLLGAFAFFLIASRPQRYRGAGYAGVGLALNIVGAALTILMATQVVRLGKMTSGTILYAIRTIDSGDREKIDAIFHESVRDRLTAERLERFASRVGESLGEPRRGAHNLGELMGAAWPDAAEAARRTREKTDIPAAPIWFERGRALVVLSVHEDVAGQLLSRGLTLESLVTDIRVVRDDGEVVALMSP